MIRIKILGASLAVISIAAILASTYSLVAPEEVAFQIVRITNWLMVLAFSVVLGWIGLVMLRAEEPKSAEEIREELRREVEEMKEEIEKALKE